MIDRCGCSNQPHMRYPARLAYGSYYHNVYGEVELTNADPAMNDWEARQFWNSCARLSEGAKRRQSALCAVLPDLRL